VIRQEEITGKKKSKVKNGPYQNLIKNSTRRYNQGNGIFAMVAERSAMPNDIPYLVVCKQTHPAD
jgi:hypothetical protein